MLEGHLNPPSDYYDQWPEDDELEIELEAIKDRLYQEYQDGDRSFQSARWAYNQAKKKIYGR